MGVVLLTIRRCGHGEHARLMRHREGLGAGLTTLRAAEDALITAEENGKTRG